MKKQVITPRTSPQYKRVAVTGTVLMKERLCQVSWSRAKSISVASAEIDETDSFDVE